MSSLFETITKEEFDEDRGEVTRCAPLVNEAESVSGRHSGPSPELTYCEFCKGYYNEYHYGDVDGETQVKRDS